MCRSRFGRRTNLLLWVQAEAVAIATDLAEFVGAALALNLIFGIPPLRAGLITAVVAFGILALEQRGYRRFELAIVGLLALVAAGFAYLVVVAGRQDYDELAAGLVPHLDGLGSLGLTVGIIGATVMPHAIYLHSALPTNRIQAIDAHERRLLLRYNKWDCIVGLGAAGLINLSMLCVAAVVLHGGAGAETGDLTDVHAMLGALIGPGAALAFAVALLASGFSSSSVGTYAGQVVMAGLHRLADPAAAEAAAHDGARAGRPRPRGQSQPGTGVLPDRPVLRHHLRARSSRAVHPRRPAHG